MFPYNVQAIDEKEKSIDLEDLELTVFQNRRRRRQAKSWAGIGGAGGGGAGGAVAAVVGNRFWMRFSLLFHSRVNIRDEP